MGKYSENISSMHRVAVISDTHGILRPEAIEMLRKAELILHGGDVADQKTLDRLGECARVIAVRGNCDKEWAEELPQEACFELYGKMIYMVHNKKHISGKAEKADVIIYGHSHKYEEKEEDGRLWLNPGSGGPRRFGRPATMAVLEIDEESGSLTVKRIELTEGEERNTAGAARGMTGVEQGAAGAARNTAGANADDLCPELGSGELRGIVETIVRDLGRGKSVDRIVKTRGISRMLTEQICQIYFTHPGIDVQGVMDRIEIAGR